MMVTPTRCWTKCGNEGMEFEDLVTDEESEGEEGESDDGGEEVGGGAGRGRSRRRSHGGNVRICICD